jgi:hypothetical protein
MPLLESGTGISLYGANLIRRILRIRVVPSVGLRFEPLMATAIGGMSTRPSNKPLERPGMNAAPSRSHQRRPLSAKPLDHKESHVSPGVLR